MDNKELVLEVTTLKNRMNVFEKEQKNINEKINEISKGITEIKTLLTEKNKQEDLKNDNIILELKNLVENKVKPIETIDTKVKSNTTRIDKIESNIKWIVILVLGSVATAIMELIIR